MAEFKVEVEDNVLDDYLDFCNQMNIDGFALVQRFMAAIAQGGGAILEIPLNISGDNMEMLIEKFEEKIQNDEDGEDAIKEVLGKYLN